MPIDFQLCERIAGFTLSSAGPYEKVAIVTRELIGPQDPILTERLEALHGCLFSKIPDLSSPGRISDLVVVIRNDLSGVAYCDELQLRARVKAARDVQKGEHVF